MQKLRIPSILDLKQLKTDQNLPFYKRYTHKMYFVCNAIYSQMVYLNDEGYHKEKKQQYFVPLSSKILVDVLGNEYLNILNWMLQAGIILMDGAWREGVVSKGYRFSEQYLRCDFRYVSVNMNFHLKEAEQYGSFRFQPHISSSLKKWFNPEMLTLDDGAAEAVSSYIAEDSANDAHSKIIAQIKRNNHMMLVDEINTGNYKFMDNDKFGYRFFSPITRLPKFLRSLVKYNNEELCQIDISNSQLFFINYLLNWRNYSERKNSGKKNYKNYIWNSIITNNNTYLPVHRTIMFLKSSEKQYGKGFQKHLFFLKSANGGIYEEIVEKLNGTGFFIEGMTDKEKRSQVKGLLLKQLFANPKSSKHRGLYSGNNMLVWQCFEEMFPEVARVIAALKENDHKNMSKLLQRIESAAILGCVCKRLKKDYPDVPIFTLHDCIVTTKKHIALVESIMKEEIGRLIGISPSLSTDSWSKYANRLPITENLKNAA